MTVDVVRKRFGKFEARMRRRNVREYAAAVFVIAVVAAAPLWESNRIVLIGGGLMALGALFVVYYLHRWGSVRTLPADLALKDCHAFHRAELQRQRDLLQKVWLWYLLPLIPGPALIVIGRAIERPGRRFLLTVYSLVFVAAFFLVERLNQRGARRIQRVIDELDQDRP